MNPQITSLTLVDRIERLEKQNRRLKLSAIATGLVIAAVIVIGQAAPKRIVEANEFVLRDASGNVRARLGMYKDPTSPDHPRDPRLALFDEKGQQTITLNGDGYFPMLTAYDSQGHPRIEVGAVLDGGYLTMTSSGAAFETMLHAGELLVTGDRGFARVDPDAMTVFDENHKVIWKAP